MENRRKEILKSGGSFPLLSRGGVDATLRKCCEATFDGADGVVLVQKNSRRLTNTTFTAARYRACAPRPSALAKVASRLFPDRAASPPRLRRGIIVFPKVLC